MKGLLLKDWYMIKQNCRVYLIIAVVFSAASVVNEGNLFFVFYPCMLCGMIPVMLLGYDERSRWDQYCGTLPYTKAQVVSGKYLVGLCVQGAMLLLTGIVQGVKMGLTQTFYLNDFIVLMLLLLAMATFSSSITLPFIFKLGIEKGRTAYYVTIGIICGLCAAVSKVLKELVTVEVQPNGVWVALALAGICIYIFSWYMSIVFYKKREL